MRRVAVVLVVAILGLAGCAESGVDETDAYAIGCPAIDAALAGGSVAGTAAVAGLRQIRGVAEPETGTQRWIDAAITLLESADPDDLPAEARALLVDGCADHGHALRNLAG